MDMRLRVFVIILVVPMLLVLLLLLSHLGAPILEPDLDLALGELQLVCNFLLPRYGYVLVQPELVLELDSLRVIVDDPILVLGSGFVFRHFLRDIWGALDRLLSCSLSDSMGRGRLE